jgi:hypothetical protein
MAGAMLIGAMGWFSEVLNGFGVAEPSENSNSVKF